MAWGLTPSRVKSISERAHDLADDIGFNGIGDWILERGADGSDAEHEGEGDFLPASAEEGSEVDGGGDGGGDGDGDHRGDGERSGGGGPYSSPYAAAGIEGEAERGSGVSKPAHDGRTHGSRDVTALRSPSLLSSGPRQRLVSRPPPRRRRPTHPLSVLQRATSADVRLEPYPHIVVTNALPAKLYAQVCGSGFKVESPGFRL